MNAARVVRLPPVLRCAQSAIDAGAPTNALAGTAGAPINALLGTSIRMCTACIPMPHIVLCTDAIVRNTVQTLENTSKILAIYLKYPYVLDFEKLRENIYEPALFRATLMF